jgi:hypothetical protein
MKYSIFIMFCQEFMASIQGVCLRCSINLEYSQNKWYDPLKYY